jgi:hypothetical protein
LLARRRRLAAPAPLVHLFDEAGTTISAAEDWRSAYLT